MVPEIKIPSCKGWEIVTSELKKIPPAKAKQK